MWYDSMHSRTNNNESIKIKKKLSVFTFKLLHNTFFSNLYSLYRRYVTQLTFSVFGWLLCFSTCFRVLRAPERWSKYLFLSSFQPVLFNSNVFQWFFGWNCWKHLKTGTQRLSYWVDFLLFYMFLSFFGWFHSKKFWNEQKRLKTAK